MILSLSSFYFPPLLPFLPQSRICCCKGLGSCRRLVGDGCGLSLSGAGAQGKSLWLLGLFFCRWFCVPWLLSVSRSGQHSVQPVHVHNTHRLHDTVFCGCSVLLLGGGCCRHLGVAVCNQASRCCSVQPGISVLQCATRHLGVAVCNQASRCGSAHPQYISRDTIPRPAQSSPGPWVVCSDMAVVWVCCCCFCCGWGGCDGCECGLVHARARACVCMCVFACVFVFWLLTYPLPGHPPILRSRKTSHGSFDGT
jgi:hypothetical protein